MMRVYTASKLGQAPRWRKLQQEWPHVIFHARWLRHVELGTPDTPDNAARFWVEDEEDARTADALLIYAEPHEHLRGALVEAGIAIANKVRVIVVGTHDDYGTWQYHPNVMRAHDFNDASRILQLLDTHR